MTFYLKEVNIPESLALLWMQTEKSPDDSNIIQIKHLNLFTGGVAGQNKFESSKQIYSGERPAAIVACRYRIVP